MSGFLDFHFPLPLVEFIKGLLGIKDPNTPVQEVNVSNREWFSQPRSSTDPTVEVHTTRFRLPLSISEIGFEALRVPCHIEVWYQDRNNNWRQMLDQARIPLTLDLSGSDNVGWYKYRSRVYPIVAKAFRIHVRRNTDLTLGNLPYVVGLKEILCRRNVYDRSDGTQNMEDEQDILGNVISKYIKDWDAPKAIDDDPITYWRSAPQPDPNAVCALYMDVRAKDGAPQLIDRLYIDPVYTGQHLNLYYSSDDTANSLKLSPISMPPLTDTNTIWTLGRGRSDVSVDPTGSEYSVKGLWGPRIGKPVWMGIEWSPDFDPTDGPALNPILFQVIQDSVTTGVFTPVIYYDVGAEELTLEFSDGTTTTSYSAPFAASLTRNETLRIVVGWAYDPDSVYLSVVTKTGRQVAFFSAGSADILDGGDPSGIGLEDSVDGGDPDDTIDTSFDGGSPTEAGGGTPIAIPPNISLDGDVGMKDFRGLVTAWIIKQEHWSGEADRFQANSPVYVSPDPVIPDGNGHIPSTTLDNALLAVDWTLQETVSGGGHFSHYSDKEWTPIWKDYMSQKGMLFFPQALSMKYLKLEFTNLTEEPYPIYDVGIETSYQVYPVSVQQASARGPQVYFGKPGGFLGLGNIISVNGIRSVNWLNPSSVIEAYGTVFGKTTDPVIIQTGSVYTSNTLPNIDAALIEEQRRLEFGNKYIYRRDALNPYVLAQDSYNTTIKAEGLQVLAPYTDIPWTEIERANQGAIQKTPTPGSLPIRGTDWWIFPGQTLQIPAAYMEQMLAGDVVRDFRFTSEHRVRFQTTSVHRYDIRTVRRDAAMAYFAGVREVTPYTTTFIDHEDKQSFDFAQYDRSQWVFSDIVQLPSGPISSDDAGTATLFKDFQTTSTFAKAKVEFRDSGLLRSDPMWQDIDPVDGLSTELAYYVETIPSSIPAGFWGDTFAEWSDEIIDWGEPHAVVSVNIDGNRQYQDKRVLHFKRDAGAGTAGIKVKQWTHFVRNGLFRLGAVFLKPIANDNQITVRLRRDSDGVYIYEETIQKPVVGYWYEFQTKFVEIPDVEDQEYTVELVMAGDDADELFLSDLYTEIAHVRYFVRLGGSGTLHDVTDLRYATGNAIVSVTTPVNEMSVSATFLTNECWAYGCTITPAYLK